MPKVNYVSATGLHTVIEAGAGDSVMEAAVRNGVPGIDAECGGACACATCHVMVSTDWLSRLPPAAEAERTMLEFAVDPQPNSRLACQIRLTAELDGLVVHTPVSQR
ncbi:2Fe-2S iron-sulfur cluster-binding protein [Nitrospirillum bahiense]|uniref:2Fe-2S ferredoxin n=1 Tax=Nitrospirillum amazonense TaxID=28077 RepID=A0A560FVK3_9PROT|nr:2Fe-2S iron-sulfur cluster-binding protein [Nitrospirillum amazonense]TWB25667.1 2Fe-2S ferredoxin [Nitrospirillum amazonense]